jgi:hypothetical protein
MQATTKGQPSFHPAVEQTTEVKTARRLTSMADYGSEDRTH